MYRPPLARWTGRGFAPPERSAWEIVLTPRGASFCLTVPAPWQQVIRRELAVVWPRAVVEGMADPFAGVQPVAVARLELRRHYMFSLRADHRSLGVLPGLLEATRLLSEGELAAIQVLLDPAPPDWWHGAAMGYESFRRGRLPRRWQLDGKTAGLLALRGVTWAVLEVCGLVTEFLSGEPPEPVELDGPNQATALRELPIGTSVADKVRQHAAFDVTIRIAVQAASPQVTEAVLHTLSYAFCALDGDNALVAMKEASAPAWARMADRQPGLKLNRDYLGLREVAMLTLLPTLPLQAEFSVAAVAHPETRLPAILTGGGLRLGLAPFRGGETPAYLPTGNLDELCLPHVVMGMMGSGKSTFAASLAYEAARAGMGAVIIDPARGEIGDELAAVLPPEQLTRVRFGQRRIALDWREAWHGERARNRLAGELIAFLGAATDEAGAQTVRYLRAAAKAVPSGRLSEVARLFTDMGYLEQLLPSMRSQERETWAQFRALTDARRTQIALPVLNRLDIIMGDDYLAECMEARGGLDLVELLSRPRVVVLDIPAGDLGREAVDVLAALCATKLDLAMVLRKSRHPVFCMLDEPHQYMRGARTWRAAVVEARKWRFSYTFLFHSWEQLPRDVAAIIRAAGPHYHLYTTSKRTYQELQEEIAPITVEEALRTPRHWALLVLRAGGQAQPPFLCRMDPPPSKRRQEVPHVVAVL